jgi:hypothetical protein
MKPQNVRGCHFASLDLLVYVGPDGAYRVSSSQQGSESHDVLDGRLKPAEALKVRVNKCEDLISERPADLLKALHSWHIPGICNLVDEIDDSRIGDVIRKFSGFGTVGRGR